MTKWFLRTIKHTTWHVVQLSKHWYCRYIRKYEQSGVSVLSKIRSPISYMTWAGQIRVDGNSQLGVLWQRGQLHCNMGRDGMGWDARDGTEKSDERRRRKKKRKRGSDRRVMIGGEKRWKLGGGRRIEEGREENSMKDRNEGSVKEGDKSERDKTKKGNKNKEMRGRKKIMYERETKLQKEWEIVRQVG